MTFLWCFLSRVLFLRLWILLVHSLLLLLWWRQNSWWDSRWRMMWCLGSGWMASFQPQVRTKALHGPVGLTCIHAYTHRHRHQMQCWRALFLSPGVYKGLHLSSTTPTALVHPSPSTAGSALLQPSNITQTSGSHSALSHQVTAANSATTQVLFGNNIRLTVPSSVPTVNSIAPINARHIPRTLSAVPSSALKLAAAANCQVSKVPSSSSVDSVPRWVVILSLKCLSSKAPNFSLLEWLSFFFFPFCVWKMCAYKYPLFVK